jgi:hypothetical protein
MIEDSEVCFEGMNDSVDIMSERDCGVAGKMAVRPLPRSKRAGMSSWRVENGMLTDSLKFMRGPEATQRSKTS